MKILKKMKETKTVEKTIFVKIEGQGDDCFIDLDALEDETIGGLMVLIQKEHKYKDNTKIKNGEFGIWDGEGMPVSKDNTVKNLKDRSKLQIRVNK